jgi:hypothetical protein
LELLGSESVVRATHAGAGIRLLTFGYGHDSDLSEILVLEGFAETTKICRDGRHRQQRRVKLNACSFLYFFRHFAEDTAFKIRPLIQMDVPTGWLAFGRPASDNLTQSDAAALNSHDSTPWILEENALMQVTHSLRAVGVLLVGLLLGSLLVTYAAAGQYLVADRLLGRVLRYSAEGSYLGTLIDDPGFGTGPMAGGISGITLSPNQSRLYISDRTSNRVAVYSYNGSSAAKLFDITAPTAAPSTIFVPASVLFSQDASEIYVANLGPFSPLPSGTTVAQLTPDGMSAGPDLTGGPAVGRSGLAFNPAGELLVSSFSLFGDGGVLRFNSASNQFETFVSSRPELRGAANILTVGNDLYVAAGGGGRVGKFNATTGALDTNFGIDGYIGPNANFAFPASLALGPSGNSLLVGVLGATNGDSRVDEYDFNGDLLRVWATNTHGANFPGGDDQPPIANALGFSEPTGIVFSTIPEPASIGLVLLGAVALSALRRRG